MIALKKYLVGLLIIPLLFACQNSTDKEVTTPPEEDVIVDAAFTGTVEELNQSMAIILIEEGDILNSGNRVSVDVSSADEPIEVGDQVRVGYEGGVMESYPLQINMTFVEKIE